MKSHVLPYRTVLYARNSFMARPLPNKPSRIPTSIFVYYENDNWTIESIRNFPENAAAELRPPGRVCFLARQEGLVSFPPPLPPLEIRAWQISHYRVINEMMLRQVGRYSFVRSNGIAYFYFFLPRTPPYPQPQPHICGDSAFTWLIFSV